MLKSRHEFSSLLHYRHRQVIWAKTVDHNADIKFKLKKANVQITQASDKIYLCHSRSFITLRPLMCFNVFISVVARGIKVSLEFLVLMCLTGPQSWQRMIMSFTCFCSRGISWSLIGQLLLLSCLRQMGHFTTIVGDTLELSQCWQGPSTFFEFWPSRCAQRRCHFRLLVH